VRAAVSYYDWHERPGYWGDVTRHFPPHSELLDIGCGTGWLADHFPSYTGIDGSPEAVALARHRGRNVIEGDVERPLPFADEAFTAVVMKDLLEHVADPVALVREARRVLRAGGLLFADNGFEVARVGYESVAPGVGLLAARTRRKRRPRLLGALALLPFHRRNVYVLARRADPRPHA